MEIPEEYKLTLDQALDQICSTCITPIMKRKDPAMYYAAVQVTEHVLRIKEIIFNKRNQLKEESMKDFYDTSNSFGGQKYLTELIEELYGPEKPEKIKISPDD